MLREVLIQPQHNTPSLPHGVPVCSTFKAFPEQECLCVRVTVYNHECI